MSSIIVTNQIQYARITEDTNGISVNETYLVSGLNPASRSILYDALSAPGMPQYAEAHPYVPGVLVSSRVPRPFLTSKSEAYVDVTWKVPQLVDLTPSDPPVINFHATTKEVESSKFIDGSIIKVRYKDSGGTVNYQIGKITALKSTGILDFRFAVSSDPSYLLGYFGRMNSSPWRGGAKYTWAFLDANIEKQKYRPYYNVQASFYYDPETHIKTAFYTLASGIIPEDITTPIDPYTPEDTDGNGGWRNVAPTGEVDFNALGFPTTF